MASGARAASLSFAFAARLFPRPRRRAAPGPPPVLGAQCTTRTGVRAALTTRCDKLPRLPASSAPRPRLPMTTRSALDAASKIASSGGFISIRIVYGTPACSQMRWQRASCASASSHSTLSTAPAGASAVRTRPGLDPERTQRGGIDRQQQLHLRTGRERERGGVLHRAHRGTRAVDGHEQAARQLGQLGKRLPRRLICAPCGAEPLRAVPRGSPPP